MAALPGTPGIVGVEPPTRIGPRTPAEWRDILAARLDAQMVEIARPEAYYNGDHPLQFATSKFKEAFGYLFSAFADNWCPIVVDAPVQRLSVVGFRFDDTENANKDAWRIWQDNNLDVESRIAHTEAGKVGRCYLLVDPNNGDPLVTVEHASQVIVARDPARRRNRLAALKRWTDDEGFWHATLFLPGNVFKWRSKSVVVYGSEIEWQPAETGRNPFGVVPVIEMENRPGLMTGGISDLKPAMPLQNAINKLCTDMIVASEFGAFRQRVLTGVEIPRDPETGQPLAKAEVTAAMSRIWSFEAPDAKVYDLAPTDLNNFVKAVEMFIQHLAAQTQTPPHYLIGQIVNASGDALKAAEAGLTSKCRDKILYFSDPWEEAMALAYFAKTGTKVTAADGEVLWADPEQRSLGELVDAGVKKRTIGVPLEFIWRDDLGYTPQQVDEMKRLAGLPDRPPAGATTANVPPVLGGQDTSGAPRGA